MLKALSVCLIALTACAVEPGPTVTPPPPATTTATTQPVTTTSSQASSTTSVPADACPEGDVMLADGGLLSFERPTADGTRIAGITWRVAGACQVFTIAFATADGAPATSPPTVTARLLRNAGVLRIETEATASVVVDQLVEEGIVERLFVPVDEAGNRFVDLVLSGPAVARARVLTSPARLEVEIQAGGSEAAGRPLMSPSVVIVEPGSAAVAEPIIDLTGYSIGEVESLDVSVLLGEEPVTETTLDLEPSPGLWTAFHLTIPVGDSRYDTLRVTAPDDSVIAAIPFSQ